MSDLKLRRVQCRYVYCRKYFQQSHGLERYCCPEHRMSQARYALKWNEQKCYSINSDEAIIKYMIFHFYSIKLIAI